MNDIEYREALDELRDVINEAATLADRVISERKGVDLDVTDACHRLKTAIAFVESAIQENE